MRAWIACSNCLDVLGAGRGAPLGAERGAAVPAGRDGVDADFLLGVFGGDLTGEADHAGLGRRIADRPRRRSPARSRAGRGSSEMLMIEPGPGSISASALAGGQEHAAQVDRHQPVPVGDAVFVGARRVGGDAGVVDEDVDAAVVVRDRLPHRRRPRPRRRHRREPPRPCRATAWRARRSRRRPRDCGRRRSRWRRTPRGRARTSGRGRCRRR